MGTGKNLLLIIDAQYDFCNEKGSLFVPGAVEDMDCLASFIKNNITSIDHIVLSQDSHQVIDISHPAFWRDKSGKYPNPFTSISAEEVESGEWTPLYEKDRVIKYLKQLHQQGEFPHLIWPEHCIDGTLGASIVDNVMDEVKKWSRESQQYFTVIQKGQNPLTEHFGLLRANIPDENDISTQENKKLLDLFSQCSKLYVAGEAKSHCVANTIKQILPYKVITDKLVIIKNCMSPVTGYEYIADYIYEQLAPNQFIEV